MKAIILAAGYSSRLGNQFEDMPKGLLDINGKSIIQRQITLFHEKKIDDIIINIFNQSIDKQPAGIADMGCGDGTLLIHLYNIPVVACQASTDNLRFPHAL